MSDCHRRLLYLITSHVSGQFLRGQLGFMRDQGFEVHVGANLAGAPSDVFDSGVVLHHVPFARDPSPLQDIRALLATVHLIGRVRPTIVNSSTPKAGLVGTIASWLRRVPSRVYLVRGLRYETMAPIPAAGYKLLEMAAMSAATVVVFNSPSALQRARHDKLLTRCNGLILGNGTSNGIDLDELGPPRQTDTQTRISEARDCPVIGFVGRLTPDKGVDDLAECARLLAIAGLKPHFMVVGEPEGLSRLSPSTKVWLESDQVTLRGYTPKIRDMYMAMDVLVFPSYREGFPNVPVEAQALGIPVVAYASTGTVDAVVEPSKRLLSPPGDTRRLAEMVRYALEDPGLSAECATKSREEISKRFGREVVWRAWLDLYRDLSAGVDVASSHRKLNPTFRSSESRDDDFPG